MVVEDEIIGLTDRLVRFRSYEDNPEEIHRCADFIDDYFREEDVFIRRFTKNNVPSLYISLQETNQPTVIFNAHFDVVPASESMFTPRMQGNYMIGRGVYDDKGQLATFMVMMKELAREEDRPNIALVTTGDEERGGGNGAAHVMEQDITADFAIIADGGGLNKYSTKAKGILGIRLDATGIDSHGSRPWLGKNAIELLMEAHLRIKELFPSRRPDHWEKTLNLGVLKGGEAPNIVPRQAESTLDIRFTEHDDPEEIVSEIKEICQDIGNITVEVQHITPFFVTDEDNAYVRELLHISQDIMQEQPEITADHGGSDARYFSHAGIPTVVTNPQGGNHHSNEEYLDVSQLSEFYDIMRNFSLRVA
jgi:succinyl-diaminopimelate desuccinylase